MIAVAQIIQQRFKEPLALDYQLLGAALTLLFAGLVFVTSATFHRSEAAPWFYAQRHMIAIFIGLGASLVTLAIPMREWERWSPWLYTVGLLLLVMVLIPGVGREANGARRWIPMGPFNLQSSEFMKLFMMMFLAGYLHRRESEVARKVWGFIKPIILIIMASVLILLQPDLGTTFVLMMTALGMLWLAGVPLWQFSIILAMAAAAVVALIVFEPFRWERIKAFIDPFADPLDSGYQLSNALIAFGRGEWFGVGIGNGIQKLFYLPEAHNDFLLAVIGEELGMMGTVAVIALFTFIAWRAIRIAVLAEKAGNRFSVYVAYGCGLWIGLQGFINIAVNLGMMPTKGLTLPLMSYGGNSIIVACLVIAILQRIHMEVSGIVAAQKPVKKEGALWRRFS
ncbi:putative lipid II flippase FtsW [Solemya velum gill symbiont]|uniref:putative lipid II flippase FtsW n=1 Tax=Solemya velum gill symbiont TaxID=2340 RepID=UPI000995EB45|nr:putative lipid II flippase FtsW [Solemya velum gill symbiont]OOZ80547.1 putative lipid II flippase FtsW [Solemya velum gill symbiont]